MRLSRLSLLSALAVLVPPSRGDDMIHRYEGDVLPYDESAGWMGGPCEEVCEETVEDGRLRILWTEAAEWHTYLNLVSNDGEPPAPSTLWVEWRFRSNHPIGPNFYTCDGSVAVRYLDIYAWLYLYGDAVFSNSGDDAVRGLDLDRFHTVRFESPNGVDYQFSVDGIAFWKGSDAEPSTTVYVAFAGYGGCSSDQFPNMVNEWDYVHFGTLDDNEQIAYTTPPSGFLDPSVHDSVQSFVVAFDAPNFADVEDISVDVTAGDAPEVLWTRRRDVDGPESFEVILDRPLAVGETTRFIFNGGGTANTVRYTLAYCDSDGDGDVDLEDVAAFQRCFDQPTTAGACRAFDVLADGIVDLNDYPGLGDLLSDPRARPEGE